MARFKDIFKQMSKREALRGDWALTFQNQCQAS